MSAAAFLLAAARRFVLPKGAPPLPSLDAADAPELLRLAAAHAVLIPLSRSLPADALPADAAVALRAAVANEARASLARAGELVRVAAALQRAGISFLALKGPSLSCRLYGALGRRSSGDLDLLVAPDAAVPTVEALTALGYELAAPAGWTPAVAARFARDAELTLYTSEHDVDLHWRALPPYFPSPLGSRDGFAWENAGHQEIAGFAIPDVAGEALLLLLCVHAAKHVFERLGWIHDVAACLAAAPECERGAALDQARATRTLRPVAAALCLAEELFGVPAPRLPADAAVDSAVAFVRRRLAAGVTGHTPAAVEIPFALRLLDTTAQRLRYLGGQFQPSAAEWAAWPLPPGLRGLYYPYRPMRLARRLCFTQSRTD